MEDTPYIGTGGDEVNEKCMVSRSLHLYQARLNLQFADPVTRASLKEKGWTLDQALDAFTSEIHEPIHAARKTPVVWQDMVSAVGAVINALRREMS
jgi:hexosaminidase